MPGCDDYDFTEAKRLLRALNEKCAPAPPTTPLADPTVLVSRPRANDRCWCWCAGVLVLVLVCGSISIWIYLKVRG